MKKQEVTKVIDANHTTTVIYVKDSCLGKSVPNAHSLRMKSVCLPKSSISGIKIGDIIRCDNLPFMSRGNSVPGYYYESIGDKKMWILRKGKAVKQSIQPSIYLKKKGIK